MESKKIIHVHLKNVEEGAKQDYYFGSLKAIFCILSKEQIGRNYESLKATSIAKTGGVFENKKCVIRIDELIRSPWKNKAE